MKKRTIVITTAIALVALGLGTALASVSPLASLFAPSAQDTTASSFTYRGVLTDSGSPANGTYDFEFSIYADATGAPAKGAAPTITRTALVTNGVFTTSLDFGAAAIAADLRYLEIKARSSGTTAFTALKPRQFLSSVPFAVNAGTASDSTQLGGQSASAYVRKSGSTISGNLTLNGQLRITSGTPGAGKVLISDANGNATWGDLPAGSTPTTSTDPEVPSVSAIQALNNTARVEISSVMVSDVVIIEGPGWDIERISGFSGSRPNDLPGLSSELPFVFEYKDEGSLFTSVEAALQADFEQFTTSSVATRQLHSLSTIVSNRKPMETGADEAFRVNLFDYGLTSISAGSEGRQRYTYTHPAFADNTLDVQHGGSGTPPRGNLASRNPATDNQAIEIEGINTGTWPQIAVDTANRTITLTYDYEESLGIFEWASDTAIAPAGATKKVTSIIEVNQQQPILANGSPNETSRTNYFGVFPIRYQMTEGFGTYSKIKQEIVLNYDYEEAG